MSRILTVTIFALMLAGCASSYDKSAVPDAAATMRRAMATCDKEQTGSKLMACTLAAQRDFAVAIHLPKMDAFDAYAAQMMALAADWEAGRVSPKQMNARAASIRNDYRFACNCGLAGRRDFGSFGYDIVPSIIMPRP